MNSDAFELGLYTFGNTPRTSQGGLESSAQAIRNALEAVKLADEAELNYFGFGEHHTRSMPISSPTAMISAAAASTRQIKLGTTVTILSTDDPIRIFQQLAIANAMAPGRIELVAGRGTSGITFQLFDADERDYDMLFASKLELLMQLNRGDNVRWNGPHRKRALDNAVIMPQPEKPLPIWLGSGGSPESVLRAAKLGLPLFLGILGGSPEHWARYGEMYRGEWAKQGRRTNAAKIAVAVHGFVGEDNKMSKTTYLKHELRMFETGSAEIGRPMRGPPDRAADLERGGMVFAGGVNELAERILELHEELGHSRQIFQMDVGGMPHGTFLKAIELLGSGVLPQVKAALGNT